MIKPALVVCAHCAAMLLTFWWFPTPARAQQGEEPHISAPHKPVAPELLPPKQWHSPAVQRSMTGGLWITDPNYRAGLYLKNDVETSALTVTPVIYLANGAKYTLPDVQLEPAGSAVIDLNAGLAHLGIAPWAALSGYVEVQYRWPWDALCATVRNLDVVHSEQFNFGLVPGVKQMPKHYPVARGDVFEGLWWKQEPNVTGFVALSNLTNRTRSVSLQTSERSGRPLGEHSTLIPPHGTALINLEELKSAESPDGGLRVAWSGGPDDIAVNGGLEDQSTGYSANIPFASMLPSSDTPIPRRYSELGLMTGAADPMMWFPAGTRFTPYTVLRNISDQPISITPRLYWMEGGAPRHGTLSAIKLVGRSSLTLDMPAALQRAGLGNFNGAINVILDVTGPRFALLAAAGSVDQKNNYVFGVAPSAVKESVAKSLSYWSTGEGNDTMVTLWNPADEAQDLLFTLFFTAGQYALPIHLEGKETRAFNISELISNQVPDEQGRTVPVAIHEGSAMLSGPRGESEHILVSFEAGTYNVQKATCGKWCGTCTGATESFITSDPWAVALSNSIQETYTAQYNTGKQFNITSASTWSSSNTTIATVSTGKITGHVVGGTHVASNDDDVPDYTSGCYTYEVDCPLDEGVDDQAPGGVPPTLSITDGLWFFGKGNTVSGYPTSATITADGASGGTFNWSIPTGTSKISFSSSSSVTSTQTSANSVVVYSTSYSTAMNDVSVALSWNTPDGENLAATPLTFQVDSPYQQAMDVGYPYGIPIVCGTNNSIDGYSMQYEYTVGSFFGNSLPNVPENESFGTRTDYYSGNKWPSPTPQPYTTNAKSAYGDMLAACWALTPSTATYGNGNTLVFGIAQTLSLGTLTAGGGIPVQTDTILFYTDHASESGTLSPVR